MEYEIYIDVFAMTSFGMDVLSLFLTDVFLGRERGIRKMWFPSFCGTFLGILLFLVLKSYGLYIILLHFLVNPFMVWLAFREKTKRRFLEDWGVTYLVVLLSGGIMQWIYQTILHGQYRVIAMGMTVFLGLFAAMVWRYQTEVGKQILQVQLFVGDEIREMKAYYDTGNLLTDPYVKKPVSIVSGDEIRHLLKERGVQGRLIPFSSLGKEQGLIEVYTCEKMLIYKGKRVITEMPAVVGLAGKSLFAHGEYQMILNSHLL